MVELLSPAGDWPSLRAAIDSGADAIYFGIKELNIVAGTSTTTFQGNGICKQADSQAFTLQTTKEREEIELCLTAKDKLNKVGLPVCKKIIFDHAGDIRVIQYPLFIQIVQDCVDFLHCRAFKISFLNMLIICAP